MKKFRTFASVFIFGAAFVFGFNSFRKSIDQGAIDRDPAAVHNKIFNPGTLSKEDIQSQLLKRFKIQPVLKQDNSISKSLVFSGVSAQLCKTYSSVELSFVADGASVSGEPTTLKVVAPCEVGQNPLEMGAIALPIQEILAEKPRSSEFRFSGYSGRYDFSNVTDEWPRTWVLRSIRFLQIHTSAELNVFDMTATAEVRAPIVLEF